MRPDMNLTMGEDVIMPNHIHAIIRIGENEFNSQNSLNNVNLKSKFGPQSKNISSIMRGFKSSVTMKARLINPNFKWKTRFHDLVIRDSWAFYNIEKYIRENPEKWKIE
ncbi:transposase [Brumimicrobium mesophilum]|uniref:transposase n=1 Tax=Brumimicrobium mesophilum TaxID=392717 RepID=UPI0018FE1D10|nr:transposase [Brumimicrobium mesophilum]